MMAAALAIGDTVTIPNTPGIWRIAAFLGRSDRMSGHSPTPPPIADLERIDRTWSIKTSAYVTSLRAHQPTTHQEHS